MDRKILVILFLAVLASTAFAQKTYTVANVDQLLRAIGPDTTVVLKPGTYAIRKSPTVKNEYIRWDEAGGDDYQLTIRNLSKLTIKAQSGDVGIIATTAYAYVLAFQGCDSIRLEGLTMGHEASEPCMAGVVSFEDTNDVLIESCDLYGSGAWGINAARCLGISLADTTIRDCSYAAAMMADVSDLVFRDCVIIANAANPLFNLENVENVEFSSCQIGNNIGEMAVTAHGDPAAIVHFDTCAFRNNDIGSFRDPETVVEFSDCVFVANAFGDDPVAISASLRGDEGYEEVPEPFVYSFEPCGLAFLIPPYWDPTESEDGKSLRISDMDGTTRVIVSELYRLQPRSNIAKNARRYLEEGLKAYDALMKKENATASLTLDKGMLDIGGLPAAGFRGLGQFGQAPDVFYRGRLVIYGNAVWGVLGIADSEEETGDGSDLGTFIDSIGLMAQGE